MSPTKQLFFQLLAFLLVIFGFRFLAIGAAPGAIAALDLQATDEDKLYGLGLYPTFVIAGLLITSGVVVWCRWGRDQLNQLNTRRLTRSPANGSGG